LAYQFESTILKFMNAKVLCCVQRTDPTFISLILAQIYVHPELIWIGGFPF